MYIFCTIKNKFLSVLGNTIKSEIKLYFFWIENNEAIKIFQITKNPPFLKRKNLQNKHFLNWVLPFYFFKEKKKKRKFRLQTFSPKTRVSKKNKKIPLQKATQFFVFQFEQNFVPTLLISNEQRKKEERNTKLEEKWKCSHFHPHFY